MRTISPFEFVRRFHHGVTNHDGRFVWFLGAGCSVSSGIADAADTTRRWLSELKYLETGDTGGLEDWARARFERYDADDLAPLYGSVLNELFYTGQEQERELERINSAAEPGFGYATLAQLVTHANWGERCNTIVTTNFDDLAADALYLYSQQRPQVLTHESFDRRIRISTARPTILKIYGDAHLAEAGSHAGETLLRPDVKDRLRAQFTESSLVFVGYGGRDESVCDLLSGLPSGAPAGGIFWINARDPAPAMLEWLEGRNAVATPYSDFEGLMFLIRREFRLGHPRIDRFDQILKRYDAQFRALAAREDLQRQTGGGSRAPAPMLLPEEETPVGKLAFPPAEPDPEPEAAQAPELTVEASDDSAEISDAARVSAIAAGLETLDEDDPWPGEFRDSFEAEDVIPHDEEPDAAEADADVEPSAFNGSSFAAMPEEDTVSADGSPETSDKPEPASIEDEPLPAQEPESAEEAAPSTIPHGRIDRLIAAAVEAMASEQRDVERARAEAAAAADDEEAARSAAAPVRLLDDEDDEADVERPAVAALDEPEETAPEQPVVNEAPAREARGNIAPFPGRFSQRLELPRRLLGRSDAAELDRRYLAALQDTPNNPKLLGRYAQFLATGKRDNDGAEHYFNRAIDADPQDGEVLRAFASFLTDVRRDYDRAEDCYRLALRADFDDTVTLCAYANFLWKSRGDLQAAGECFQVAVDGAPRDSRALCSYARFLRDVAHNEDAAYALLKLAVASTRFDPAPSVELARFLATSRGEMAKAESTFRHALRVAPDSAETLAAAASFFADSLGDLDEGERLFRQAVAADKDEPVVLRAYASFKARHRGDMDAAEHLLGRAIDADPGDCTTALAYARFLEEEKRDADGADEYYRRAVHLDPRNAEALAAYARFLYRVRNNPAAAEDRFRKAIKMEPKNPDVQAGYGHFLLTAREDLDAAEPLLRAALGGLPNNPELLWDLGKLNRARGDSDGANEMFRRAVDADPRRAADLRRFSRFSKCERGDAAGTSPGDQVVESAGSDDPASLGGAAQAMFALGRAEEGISLLNNAFEAALAEDPGHRDPNLLLELWFCRFVFHDEARSDAVKAVTWLVKSGARMEPREVEALVATDLARAHPDQDMLADVASIVSGASRLEDIKKFNVA